MRRAARTLLTGAVLLAALAVPGEAAGAKRSAPLVKSIWGPASIGGESQFPVYKDLGVTLYQTAISWERAAPSQPQNPADPNDPAYRWPSGLDALIEEADRNGIKVLILLQNTPGWANGNTGWSRPPSSPVEFGRFAEAAARRFPQVRHWMIWGEPLRNMNFPGFGRDKPTRIRLAQTYAQILDASYGRLKRVSPRNVVIGGNTFTTDRKPVSWAPVPLYEWMRRLRMPNGRVPRMDMWGHNPFAVRTPSLKNGPGRSLGDISDTRRVLRRLRRNIMRPLRKSVPIFISEYCVPTGENDLFPISPSQRQQADWLSRAFRIARGEPLVWGFGWFQFQDEGPPKQQQRNTCGLIEADGDRKRAFETFKRARG